MEELDEEDGDEPDEDTPAPVVSTSGVTAAHKKVKKLSRQEESQHRGHDGEINSTTRAGRPTFRRHTSTCAAGDYGASLRPQFLLCPLPVPQLTTNP